MEEEGIFYFFKHTEGSTKMVVGNTPQAFADLPEKAVRFEGLAGGGREDDRVAEWVKSQEVRTAKWTLWDHCFEMPDKNLEAQKPVVETVTAGTVSHKLHAGELDKLETYDFPGAYAQRFDGVAPGGGDQASNLQKIFEDNQRTATIRVEAEESVAVSVSGTGNVRQMVPGHKLDLSGHPDADGGYVLTSVTHTAHQAVPAADGSAPFSYRNAFTALPEGTRFRPQRLTERPVVHGTQTAVVVGPAGQEIFTDKYGRVKVQFFWDREGKKDPQSSCWIRVGTPWAGQTWGAIHIPRIGQEVIVAFLEGDPDQPIIVGSVYNADQMPPYTLPDNMTQSGIKSRSTLKGTTDHFNELRFEDKKDAEDIYFHAQKDFHRVVENDDDLKVGHDQTIEVKNHRTETVKEGNEKVTIEKGDRTIVVSTGNDTHTVSKGNRSVSVDQGNDTHDVKTGYREATVEGDEKLTVSTGNRVVKINTGNDTLTVQTGNLAIKVSAGKATIEAAQSIELKVGPSSIKIDPSGVTIAGVKVSVEGQAQAEVKGGVVQVQGSGMVKIQGAVVMIN
jgi:type VI secretion system secreted protein VgrG